MPPIKRKRKQRYYFSYHRIKRRKPLLQEFDYDSAPELEGGDIQPSYSPARSATCEMGVLRTPLDQPLKRNEPTAPRKLSQEQTKQSAKRLFDLGEGDLHKTWKNAERLLPSFLEELEMNSMLSDFMSFMQAVVNKTFPMDNIALKLFLEVAHWYGLKSTTTMEYSSETKQFWLVGYIMFHGLFLRFMSGDKNNTKIHTVTVHAPWF